MQLQDLTAAGDPAGHRIVLTWRVPDAPAAKGARVIRRSGAFPETAVPAGPAAGVVVADTDGAGAPVADLGDGWRQVVDDGLPEGIHYYQVFPHGPAPFAYDPDPANRVAAAATAPYGFAARLAALLPAVYHRFDTVTPRAAADPATAAAAGAAHLDQGQLRRYLKLPGAELDRLYSDIRSLPSLSRLSIVRTPPIPLSLSTVAPISPSRSPK